MSKTRDESMESLQNQYRAHLTGSKADNTVATSSSDAFYLWRHVGEAAFWKVIRSKNFAADAKAYVGAAQEVFSKAGEKKSNVSGYVSHLKSIKDFIEEKHISPKEQLPVPTPSEKQVDFYLALWRHLDSYKYQEAALKKLFIDLCPNNIDIEDILIKASALNDFYSTNIYSIYPVAAHIKEKQIDGLLQEGKRSLIDAIRRVTVGEKKRDYYSFATKYCSHHKPEVYPIYDSYVDRVLRYFRDKKFISNFATDDLKNYEIFCKTLEEFMDKCQFKKEYSLKQIDQYLWQLGKDCFPKNYKKAKA